MRVSVWPNLIDKSSPCVFQYDPIWLISLLCVCFSMTQSASTRSMNRPNGRWSLKRLTAQRRRWWCLRLCRSVTCLLGRIGGMGGMGEGEGLVLSSLVESNLPQWYVSRTVLNGEGKKRAKSWWEKQACSLFFGWVKSTSVIQFKDCIKLWR